MKDFKFIETSIQGLRVYECIMCEKRFTDVSVKALRKWHTHFRKLTPEDVKNIMDNGIMTIYGMKIVETSYETP